jgi:hypothetical protein
VGYIPLTFTRSKHGAIMLYLELWDWDGEARTQGMGVFGASTDYPFWIAGMLRQTQGQPLPFPSLSFTNLLSSLMITKWHPG